MSNVFRGRGGGARKTLIVNWSKLFYASRSFKHHDMISIHFPNVKFTVMKWIKYARLVKYTTWFRLQTVKTVEQIKKFLQTCFFFTSVGYFLCKQKVQGRRKYSMFNISLTFSYFAYLFISFFIEYSKVYKTGFINSS